MPLASSRPGRRGSEVDDGVAVGREVEPARPRAAEDAARRAREDGRDELGEALQLAQVRPALARARAVRAAAEEVGARADEVVPVVAVGPQPDAERVVRDDRPGRPERERRAEAPGLDAHEVDRQRAAERARQARPEAAAADRHALGRDAPPVRAQQQEALAVRPHRRHARAERQPRSQPLGRAREAVGHEERLAHAVRGLVGADRERTRRQARLERADLRVVELLDDDALRAHGVDRRADARLAIGLADGQVAAVDEARIRAGAREHVGQELAAVARDGDDRGILVVGAQDARRGARRARRPRRACRAAAPSRRAARGGRRRSCPSPRRR